MAGFEAPSAIPVLVLLAVTERPDAEVADPVGERLNALVVVLWKVLVMVVVCKVAVMTVV